MTTRTSALTLHSQPYARTLALAPTIIIISVGWLLLILAMPAAITAVLSQPLWGIMGLTATCAFSAYMVWITYRTCIHDPRQSFLLELSDDEIRFTRFDGVAKMRTVERMPVAEIVKAEHYPAVDSNNVLLIGKRRDLELPLWAFGNRADDVLTFIKQQDIQVVNLLQEA